MALETILANLVEQVLSLNLVTIVFGAGVAFGVYKLIDKVKGK